MARTHQFFAVLGLSLVGLGTGCVSSEKYAAQKMRADQYDADLTAAQSRISSATAQNEVFKSQMEKARTYQENQAALVVNQAAQITELTRQLEEMNGKYQLAMQNIGKAGGTALPVQLVSELTTFAQQHPDIVEFDEKKGLVKFKSDVTFSSGSAVVKPEAKGVIDRLAGILNGPAASQYELMVAGHTDNTPVSNPVTKKNGHHDNWYLSSHRAIEVSKELKSVGVQPNRLQVVGFADQKPVAPNDTDGNKARNRRVEVFILPTTVGGSAPVQPSAPVAAGAPAAPRKAAAPKNGMNKDVVPAPQAEVEKKPFLSK
jgi:chemotaxis protein MotB